MEEVVVFVLAVGLAVVLIALAGVATATLGQAASGLVDWHKAKNAYPILFYADGSGNGTRVHLCVNATEVWVIKGNAMVKARGRYMVFDGRRWRDFPNMPHGRRWGVDVVYCHSYLGLYNVGDAVAYLVKVGDASHLHNYTVRIVQQR